jgi:hypothetical protein
VLSADTIRLKPQDERHAVKESEKGKTHKTKAKQKTHTNRGRHLGLDAHLKEVTPEPDRRPAREEPGDGGRLIDREPASSEAPGAVRVEQVSPVPEPGTPSLLAMGLAAAGVRAWRGRRHAA